MIRIILPVAIGMSLGALMGHFGSCTTGACPLTSTWWRGALYGGVLGLLIALSSPRAPVGEDCRSCRPVDLPKAISHQGKP